MKNNKEVEASKFLALLLRHEPQRCNLYMNDEGWVPVFQLIEKAGFDHAELLSIVSNDGKGRYSFSEDGKMLRANQGHSIDVNPGLKPDIPPPVLYHGTSITGHVKIMSGNGILPMGRRWVHLSDDKEVARIVGKRHGDPVIMHINTMEMLIAGIKFFLTTNDVWLVKFVDKKYITKVNTLGMFPAPPCPP